MCRWLAYIGTSPLLLAEAITRPQHSIVNQSRSGGNLFPQHIDELKHVSKDLHDVLLNHLHRNHQVNGDGCGIGWYSCCATNGYATKKKQLIPCVFTTISPAWNNRNLLRLVEKVESKLFFGHVRAASPFSTISEANCHPFIFGRFLWMHNGGIAHFPQIKQKLISKLSQHVYKLVEGTTDSEHAGALFIDLLPRKRYSDRPDAFGDYTPDELVKTMQLTIETIMSLTYDNISHDILEPSSLNFCVSDGKVVVAARFRNHSDQTPPSLFYSQGVGFECSMHTNGHMLLTQSVSNKDVSDSGVVISSEPLNYDSDQWILLPPNHLVLVTSDVCQPKIIPIEVNPKFILSGEPAPAKVPALSVNNSPNVSDNHLSHTRKLSSGGELCLEELNNFLWSNRCTEEMASLNISSDELLTPRNSTEFTRTTSPTASSTQLSAPQELISTETFVTKLTTTTPIKKVEFKEVTLPKKPKKIEEDTNDESSTASKKLVDSQPSSPVLSSLTLATSRTTITTLVPPKTSLWSTPLCHLHINTNIDVTIGMCSVLVLLSCLFVMVFVK